MDGCDFGWKKNQMDVVKSRGIMRIDDIHSMKKKIQTISKETVYKFIDNFYKTV